MKDVQKVFGAWVKHHRLIRGLNQAQLARKVQCKVPTLSAIEHGKADPRLSTQEAIARALGVPLSKLREADEPNPKFRYPKAELPSQAAMRVAWDIDAALDRLATLRIVRALLRFRRARAKRAGAKAN